MKTKIIENGIEYVKCGDYYIPNLTAPNEQHQIGKYGRMHGKFIKEHHRPLYSSLLIKGQWLEYLAGIDEQAQEMVDSLIKEMSINQGVTEQLKATDQIKWVGMMTNIKQSAEEIVMNDIVYSMEVQ